MAFEYRSFVTIVFQFVDAENHTSTMRLNCKPDIAVGDSLNIFHKFAQDVISSLYPDSDNSAQPQEGDVAGVACVGYNIIAHGYQTDAPSFRDDFINDVEDKSVVLMGVQGGWRTQLAVPGCNPPLQLVGAGGEVLPELDRTKLNAGDFLTFLTEGRDMIPFGFGGWVRPCDARGGDIQAIDEAYKQQRGSQKSNGRRG